jgi:hypothetical protein
MDSRFDCAADFAWSYRTTQTSPRRPSQSRSTGSARSQINRCCNGTHTGIGLTRVIAALNPLLMVMLIPTYYSWA